jgi:hypothetical protein
VPDTSNISILRRRKRVRVYSGILVACLLLFGIAANRHVHGFQTPQTDERILATPEASGQDSASCPACTLSHHLSTEPRAETCAVADRIVDRLDEAIGSTPDTRRPHRASSRAPPACL